MHRDFDNYTKENRNFGPSGVHWHSVGHALADGLGQKYDMIVWDMEENICSYTVASNKIQFAKTPRKVMNRKMTRVFQRQLFLFPVV